MYGQFILKEADMTIKESLLLRPGDTVHWNDPDMDACSRTLTIQAIEIRPNAVVIMDTDGNMLECDASELEYRRIK